MKNLALKKTLSILILTLYHTLTYSQNKNSNTYYESAMIHKQKEEYSESIKDLDKAIAIMPLTIYYYNRGIAYFILKQFEKESPALLKKLSLEEKMDDGYLGVLCFDEGKKNK